jgi:GTPase SAR1 family protein
MQIVKGKIPGAVKVVIYGPEGIGKSTMASEFPDPLFIDTEGSTKTMDVSRFEAPTKWEDVIEAVGYVKSHPDCCKTLVIDTADWAELLCIRYTCSKGNVGNIEDFGYGKGYVYLQENFKKLLDLLQEIIALGINVVVTAHAKMRKFEQPDEMGAYDRWEMKLSRQVAPMLKEWADMVLFANYKTYVIEDDKTKSKKAQGGKRVMYATHNPCWDAKNRFGLEDCLDFGYKSIKKVIEQEPEKPAKAEKPKKKDQEPAEEEKKAEPAEEKSTLDILKELMVKDGISDKRLRHAVSTKGAYFKITPLSDYDPAFIRESLISKWAGFVKYAKKFSDEEIASEPEVPFD